MIQCGRFSVALHVLAHLVERPAEAVTSEELAGCVRTNPVVVRRTLAGLRDAGLVASTKGHRGGWSLGRDAAGISLQDVRAALGERLLRPADVAGFGAGCVIEQTVSGVMEACIEDAEALLAERLSRITLADLVAQVGGATFMEKPSHAV